MKQIRGRVMRTFPRDNNPSGIWLFMFGFILLGIVAVAAVATQPSGAMQPAATRIFGAANEEIVATQSHGVLHVSIPYEARHSGAGRLIVEVLDPEDQVLGRQEQRVEISAGKGRWQQEIRPEKSMAYEELVWQRLRYRFEYNDRKDQALEGTESIAQILRTPVVHI